MEVSIHFTTKEQTTEEVKELWNNYKPEWGGYKNDNIERVNHSFLHRDRLKDLNIPTDAVDWVDSLSSTGAVDCWYEDHLGGEDPRIAMLDEMSNNGGVCFFIGKITGGVKIEYDYATEIGCNIQVIK